MDASPSMAARVARLEDQVAALTALVRPEETPPPEYLAPEAPRIQTIVEAVADGYGLHPREIYGGRREQPIAEARQVAMHLARMLTRHSFPAIGRAFGRDHTTVQYAARSISGRMTSDPALAARVGALAHSLITPQSKEAPRP